MLKFEIKKNIKIFTFLSIIYLLISLLILKKMNFNIAVINSLLFSYFINFIDVCIDLFFQTKNVSDNKKIIKNVLISISIKMFVFLLLVLLTILIFEINKIFFVISLFILYFTILLIKVLLLNSQKRMV
jgi:hypothetical protein